MTKYHVGQRIELWQVFFDCPNRMTKVLKSVIVTVAEIKTGVPEEFTHRPSTDESVVAFADDGARYERFWHSVPISQVNDFFGQWSFRDDGEAEPGSNSEFRFWHPQEAWVVYKDFQRYGVRKYMAVDRIVGPDGKDILPQGDLVLCDKHKTYQPPHIECFDCKMEAYRAKVAC